MSEQFRSAGFECRGSGSATRLADRRGSEMERCCDGSTLKAEFIDRQVDGDRPGLCRSPASPGGSQLVYGNLKMLGDGREESLEILRGIWPSGFRAPDRV